MAGNRISASALIQAPAQAVYDVIADYHEGHSRIIPRPPFVSLVVEQGGRGAGTVIRVQMRVLGRLQTYRAVISEPDPGRVLVETNDTGYVTSFIVEPRSGGQHAEVTIVTELPMRHRVAGAFERWLMTRLLRRVYLRELELLAAKALTWVAGSAVRAGAPTEPEYGTDLAGRR